jgi:hypothetical protein
VVSPATACVQYFLFIDEVGRPRAPQSAVDFTLASQMVTTVSVEPLPMFRIKKGFYFSHIPTFFYGHKIWRFQEEKKKRLPIKGYSSFHCEIGLKSLLVMNHSFFSFFRKMINFFIIQNFMAIQSNYKT